MKATERIGKVLEVLRSPWSIALLVIYALAIGILLIQKDWQGLWSGLIRTIVSLMLILITLGLTTDKVLEGSTVARPWLGLLFGVAVGGLSLGLLFGPGRFIQFKIWELEVGEAVIRQSAFCDRLASDLPLAAGPSASCLGLQFERLAWQPWSGHALRCPWGHSIYL